MTRVPLILLLCAVGCSSTPTDDDTWRDQARTFVSQGRYAEAIRTAEPHMTSEDELTRQAAMSLTFGARLAQLNRMRDLDEIRAAITGKRLLGQVANQRTVPETEDSERPVHQHGFVEPIDKASDALRKQLEKAIEKIELDDKPVSEVFRLLYERAGINILYDPKLVAEKTISLQASNLRASELLEHVSRIHGLYYGFRASSLLVLSSDNQGMLTRAYRLRRGLSEWDMSTTFDSLADLGLLYRATPLRPYTPGKPRLTTEEEEGGEEEGEGEEGADDGAGAMGLPPRRVRLDGVSGDERGSRSYLDMFLDRLPKLVTWPEGSDLFLDRRNNLLVVRSSPATLAQIGKLLDSVDADVPQILIETRYLEVAVEDTLDLGVEWSIDRRFHKPVIGVNNAGNLALLGRGKARAINNEEPAGTSSTFFGLPALGGAVTGGNLAVVGVFDNTTIEALVYTLNRLDTTNTLATPHVIASNNSRAQIAIVRNIAYIEHFEILPGQVSQTDQTVVSLPTTVKAHVNDRNYTGVLLNVKPSVGADGKTIHIVLQPLIREQVDNVRLDHGAIVVDEATLVSDPGLFRPIIETRLTTTQLCVADGATVVLGGLMAARDEKDTEKIPILGDIPMLGFLFRRDVTRKTRRNLLIFVTAKIINSKGGRLRDRHSSKKK